MEKLKSVSNLDQIDKSKEQINKQTGQGKYILN